MNCPEGCHNKPARLAGRAGVILTDGNRALLHAEQNALVHNISDSLREKDCVQIRHR